MANLERQTTRLHFETVAKLQALADEKELTVSEIIREAVNVYLAGDNSLYGIVNRVEKLETTICRLVDVMAVNSALITEQFSTATDKERDRFQLLGDWLKKQFFDLSEQVKKSAKEV